MFSPHFLPNFYHEHKNWTADMSNSLLVEFLMCTTTHFLD